MKGGEMGGGAYHESFDKLTKKSQELHRAIQSLIEELEAIDWYQQRVDATEDDELKEILAHNRDEEKEHAAMVLEWIRRNDEAMAEELKTYLFAEAKITEIEEKD
jgi:ferritin-like protein